jgi:hypothetical protein
MAATDWTLASSVGGAITQRCRSALRSGCPCTAGQCTEVLSTPVGAPVRIPRAIRTFR